mmetsp:Transcript_79621/g.140540  ORF Transcript_79621/g.140540 Transcript_79621/m.140540 type:complete len:91 (-) Transcript_79621:96-368(-)
MQPTGYQRFGGFPGQQGLARAEQVQAGSMRGRSRFPFGPLDLGQGASEPSEALGAPEWVAPRGAGPSAGARHSKGCTGPKQAGNALSVPL